MDFLKTLLVYFYTYTFTKLIRFYEVSRFPIMQIRRYLRQVPRIDKYYRVSLTHPPLPLSYRLSPTFLTILLGAYPVFYNQGTRYIEGLLQGITGAPSSLEVTVE